MPAEYPSVFLSGINRFIIIFTGIESCLTTSCPTSPTMICWAPRQFPLLDPQSMWVDFLVLAIGP